MGWHLLIPKGWAGLLTIGGVAWGLVGAVRFVDTVTIGSIVVASLVVISGGIFTLRNNVRSFWRGLAEERAEKIAAQEEEIKERDQLVRDLQEQGRADMAAFAEEQRTIRHELKNQLASTVATLNVERAKTDLTALMEQMATQHTEALNLITAGLGKQDEIIKILAGNWGNDPS